MKDSLRLLAVEDVRGIIVASCRGLLGRPLPASHSCALRTELPPCSPSVRLAAPFAARQHGRIGQRSVRIRNARAASQP